MPRPGTDEPAVAGAPDGPGPGEHAPAEAGAPAVEDGAVEDGAVEDGAEYVPTGTEVAGSVPAESVPGESVPAESVPPGTGPQAGRRRYGPYVRRGVVALLAAGLVALGVGAFAWAAPSPAAANQRFVDAAQSQGHVLAPGEQETLVISAARKICDRRTTHETDQERRATALNSDEIAAVGTAFGADTRAFTTLALKTFCSR